MSRHRSQTTITVKMTRDEIMREFFTPLEELKRQEQTPTWCDLSEARLFQLLIRFKPAGVTKYAALSAIHMYMRHIYEKEEEGTEIFLNDKDFETVRKRKDLPIAEKNLRFEPRYAIRPTIEQILARLDKYWDMKAVEYNEGVPDGFEVHSEFFLPDGQFSELLKEKSILSVQLKSPPGIRFFLVGIKAMTELLPVITPDSIRSYSIVFFR
ncbi:hypothetical protein GCK32_012478 [Trichostrongylus colubriformis]|uniref:Uncharacterized protein n=1 Tax=Trichostrongylus colubriformis TaxID=6319 RepID=A0AAN8FML2_TRICO